MSISYQKKRLIKEAIGNYHSALRKNRYRWRDELNFLMSVSGWNVTHPGADKYIAIKGPLVVKWTGECGWSGSPIADEMNIHKVLLRCGMKKNLPRVYARLPHFIIQQNLGNNTPNRSQTRKVTVPLERHGYYIADFHARNGRVFNGVTKVIDGVIRQK